MHSYSSYLTFMISKIIEAEAPYIDLTNYSESILKRLTTRYACYKPHISVLMISNGILLQFILSLSMAALCEL